MGLINTAHTLDILPPYRFSEKLPPIQSSLAAKTLAPPFANQHLFSALKPHDRNQSPEVRSKPTLIVCQKLGIQVPQKNDHCRPTHVSRACRNFQLNTFTRFSVLMSSITALTHDTHNEVQSLDSIDRTLTNTS